MDTTTRSRTWRRALVGALGTLLCAGVLGCETSNDEEIVPPPISISFIVPDNTQGIVTWDPAVPLDVQLSFNRGVPSRTVEVRMFPEPVSTGPFTPNTSTQRVWTWNDIVLSEEGGAYHLLVDGLEMLRPATFTYRVDTSRIADVGVGGEIDTANRQLVPPEGSVVFALADTTSFNPLRPETWADAQGSIVAAFAVQNFNPSAGLGPLPYRVPYLAAGEAYYMVAIKDTNGDLVYDPTQDWWGAYFENGTFEPVIALAFGGDKPDEGTAAADLFLTQPNFR